VVVVGKLIYRLLGIAFAIPTTLVFRKVLNAAWRNAQGDDPPRDPKAPDARLADVLAWAGLSALSVAVGQFVASRAAAAAYRGLTGRHAPGWDPDGAQAEQSAA
jgi:heme A synthase